MKTPLLSLFGIFAVVLVLSVSSAFAQTEAAATTGADAAVTTSEEDPNDNLPPYLQFHQRDAKADLSIPHRTQAEVLIWANQTVSSLLSFDAGTDNDMNSKTFGDYTYKKHFAEYQSKFLKKGWQQFQAYLKKYYMVERVLDKKYRVIAINEGYSFVARHGTVSGVYRWDVEIPVLLSYMDMNAPRPKDPREEPPVAMNEAAKIVLSITRVTEGGGDAQLAIAGWRVKEQKRRKSIKVERFTPIGK